MRALILLIIFCVFFGCGEDSSNPPTDESLAIRGVDISFLPELESYPTAYYNASGQQQDMLDILKANGVNTIRLRLWHTPAGEHSSLEEVIDFSERARAKGFDIWLTVHYSDTWADPGQQAKPAAWDELILNDLADSVYLYTKKVVTILQPEIIQIGNEINDGFLWPDGKISVNPANFITLMKKGVQAVRDFAPETKIMIHYAGHEGAQSYYQRFQTQDVSYDLIGLSYYPHWHGKDLNVLKTHVINLGIAYSKEVVVAETAYPFTLSWDDDLHNIVGEQGQLIPAYPATPEGQKQFLLALNKVLIQSKKATGVCYWEPGWVGSTHGSSWENLALFDFNNKALPGLEAFEYPNYPWITLVSVIMPHML